MDSQPIDCEHEEGHSTTAAVHKSAKEECQARLLELPAELRDKIYGEVAVTRRDINIESEIHPKEPTILAVCHQIRNEALPIYYGHNTFAVDMDRLTDNCPFPYTAKWIRLIGGERASMLKNMQLYLRRGMIPSAPKTKKALMFICRSFLKFGVKLEELTITCEQSENHKHQDFLDGARMFMKAEMRLLARRSEVKSES